MTTLKLTDHEIQAISILRGSLNQTTSHERAVAAAAAIAPIEPE
jgi:hypothetical protein